MTNPKPQDWKKEREEFEEKVESIAGCGGFVDTIIHGVPEFDWDKIWKHIVKLLDKQAKEYEGKLEDLERASEKARESQPPMGVSQWKAHGKKYGYWKYFADKRIERVAKKLKNSMELHTHNSIPTYTSSAYDGCITCKRNVVLEDLIKALNKK